MASESSFFLTKIECPICGTYNEFENIKMGSYNEQDRLDSAMDDLLGNFSGGSVQNNRSMNETVGGMKMISEGANQITEMTIRIFAETWVFNNS